ncbi:MAG TPA: AraC family transcriptional regulator [Thermoanaerobaculia bacterium]|nr:AraC family transcriptional regulator [Thermoanaerobaculia bacterium]
MLTAGFADFIVRERVYSAGTRLPRHSHEYSNVSIVTGGEIAEAAEGGEHEGRCCSVVMKPARSEHENRVGRNGARTLTIEVRTTSALAPEIAARTWTWFEHAPITRAGLALRCAVENGCGTEGCAVALLNLVLSASGADHGAPPWIADVERMLAQRFAESVRFDGIARNLGVHPVYLSRAFRRHAGVSMTEYVRTLRLRHARHLFTTSRRSIAAIAAESGFTDASHLSHVFSELLGMTPRAYRRMFSGV